MDLEALSAMYDPDTMDFDEFVRTYSNKNTNLREEQDLEYERSLAQDMKKKAESTEHEIQPDVKPTLSELRQLRIAKLAPKPDYSLLTVSELKKVCKERNMKGYTNKCKQELLAVLNNM